MTVIDPEIRAAIQAMVDYNWSDEQADYEQQDADGRQHHVFGALSRIADWLNEDGHEDQTAGALARSAPGEERFRSRPGTYVGWIEWDLEGFGDPREAAETLWDRIRNSPGPVIELVDGDTCARLRVDLAREPGQDDVEPVAVWRPSRSRPIVLTGISSAFATAEDIECLVRTAAEAVCGQTDDLSSRQIELAQRAYALVQDELAAPLPAEWHGRMVDGYDDALVNVVLGRISDLSGLTLVCVWDLVDDAGVGGNSQFYVEVDGRLHDLAGDLWAWLNHDPNDPDTPATAGTPDSWVGAPTDLTTADLPYDDGFHNYAVRELK